MLVAFYEVTSTIEDDIRGISGSENTDWKQIYRLQKLTDPAVKYQSWLSGFYFNTS